MTDFDKLDARRKFIGELICNNVAITSDVIRDIIKKFDSSYPSVMNDISMVTTGETYYKKYQSTTQNVRARKMGAVGILSENDWIDSLDKFNHSCAICGSKDDLCIDHKMPLSRGGTNTRDNIQPLCRECNSRKGNATETLKADRWRKAKPIPTDYYVARKTGRCANGSESDGGTLWHAIPKDSYVSLRGTEPGKRSAGWSEHEGQKVTCPRCMKKLGIV